MFFKHYIYLNLAASVFLYINGDANYNESIHGECILPNYPPNGKWVIIGGSDARPGSPVPTNTIISFSCDEQYNISGEYSVIMCLGKDWNLPFPDCFNSKKPNKIKRGIIINENDGNEYISVGNDERRPNTSSRKRVTLGRDGIVVESEGRRLDMNRQDGSVNLEEHDATSFGRKRISIGGREGGIVIEREGELVRGREGKAIGRKKITVGANGGGVLIESDGELVGERGRDGILIGIGGKRIKVNPGEEGTIYIDENGQVTRGNGYRGVRKDQSESYDDSDHERKVQNIDVRSRNLVNGIVRDKRRGAGRIVLGSGSTIVGIGGRSGSSYYNSDDDLDDDSDDDSDDDLDDDYVGRGGDGIVIDGRRVVLGSGPRIRGIGGQSGTTRFTYLNKRETHPANVNLALKSERVQNGESKNSKVSEDEVGKDGEDGLIVQKEESLDGHVIGIGQPGQSGTSRGGRGGNGVVVKAERLRRSPASNKKKNKNTSEDEDEEGENGEDGLVVGKGESLDGYVIGVGRPGQSGTSRGGKGGTGAVIKGGGRINGVVVGIGGQGGSAGSIGSNQKQNKGDQVNTKPSTTTKKPKGQTTKGSKSRIKRDPQQVFRLGVGVKVTQNSHGGILIQTTNEQRLTENGVNIPLGGQGGQGVSGLDPSKIRGVVIDIQGANGNTYFARKRRDVEAGSNLADEKEETKDRKKRQLTISGTSFPGLPTVVGGRGGDGLIIDSGSFHGPVVGTGGNGGNPTYRRKRNHELEENLREDIEVIETRAKQSQIKRSLDEDYLLKSSDDPLNRTARDLSSGSKLRIKKAAREGRRGRGEQQGIMRQWDDGEYVLGGPDGGIIERSGNTVRRLGTNDEGGIREILLNGDRNNDRDSGRGRDKYPDIDIRGGGKDGDDVGRPSDGVRCPALRNDDMVSVTCYNDRSRIVSCETATAGTSVEYKCANFYEPPTMKYQTGYCYDGEWTVQKPTCVPVCGKARLDATPQIVGGDPAKKGDYPWVAAIFKNNNNNFENVCGGSILTQKVILTAAHCVTNDFGDTLSTNLIQVGVGKYYLEYKDPKDDEAQYSEVSQILVHKSYKGTNQRFASDISLLVTKDTLRLSRLVQPVCYQDLPQFQLVNQMRGWVTGWGYTLPEGPQPEVLKQLFVPYKDEATCKTEFPTEWLDDFLTYDKFCAGFFNKSVSVCRGDSGGGLVFKNTNGRFYVQGVVSLSMNTEFKCQIQYSTLYTRVSTHYGWIREIVSLFG